MSKKPNIPVYDAKIRDTDNTGIFAMSFVEVPAVEELFVALRAGAHKVALVKNTAKQILTGVVLKPAQLIYRNDDQLGEYYLRYTAEDIERISQKMMRTGVGLRTTTHQHEDKLKGNYLTEVWLVLDPKRDKSVALGLGELPKGTLCASYKITDAKYWREEVVTGNVKGFSLEGLFNYKNVKMSKPQMTPAKAAAALGKKPSAVVSFLKSVTAMLEGDSEAAADAVAAVAADDETDSGTPFLIFTLADGSEVFVDEDGFATLDGEQMAAGDHTLDDGNILVVDDAGLMVVTTAEAEAVDPAAAPAALKAAAVQRGKALLAKQAAAKKAPNAAKIASLQAQIAKLKAEPSTVKVKQNVDGKAPETDPAKMTHAQKMAVVIQSRRERKDGK